MKAFVKRAVQFRKATPRDDLEEMHRRVRQSHDLQEGLAARRERRWHRRRHAGVPEERPAVGGDVGAGDAPARAPVGARSDDPRDPTTVEKRTKTGVLIDGSWRNFAFV